MRWRCWFWLSMFSYHLSDGRGNWLYDWVCISNILCDYNLDYDYMDGIDGKKHQIQNTEYWALLWIISTKNITHCSRACGGIYKPLTIPAHIALEHQSNCTNCTSTADILQHTTTSWQHNDASHTALYRQHRIRKHVCLRSVALHSMHRQYFPLWPIKRADYYLQIITQIRSNLVWNFRHEAFWSMDNYSHSNHSHKIKIHCKYWKREEQEKKINTHIEAIFLPASDQNANNIGEKSNDDIRTRFGACEDPLTTAQCYRRREPTYI